MKQYAYTTLKTRAIRDDKTLEELNSLGAEGWLVTGITLDPDGRTLLLVRELESQP